ncbi:MAG TPA: DUF6152 family protein [Candidatus Acidoferrales bacterium]|nr:DUF6152 family protein [Candidatus Acidoferrales bacterium]
MKTGLKQAGLAAVILAGLVAAAAGTAAAHHGFAVFDTSVRKSITGTVKTFEWTNPHTWVWLDVPNEKGGVDTWAFEGMSPNYLGRRGWTRNSLKPGDKITVTFFPLKDGSKGGGFLNCKRPTGEELTMWGGSPTEDN